METCLFIVKGQSNAKLEIFTDCLNLILGLSIMTKAGKL